MHGMNVKGVDFSSAGMILKKIAIRLGGAMQHSG